MDGIYFNEERNDSMKNKLEFLPIMLEKKDAISMSNGEEMKIAVLLSMHCFEKNDGNRIKNGQKNSKNPSWRGLRGLPHKKYAKLIEKGAQGLWHCEGDDIIVDLYSVEMEARMNAKREKASNAGRVSAEARKEGVSQRGENSTDVQRTFNNIEKNKNKNKNKEKIEGESEGEREIEAEQEEEAEREAEGESEEVQPRKSNIGIDEAQNSVDEVLSYLKKERSNLANDSPDLLYSVANEFCEKRNISSGGSWEKELIELFNLRFTEYYRKDRR